MKAGRVVRNRLGLQVVEVRVVRIPSIFLGGCPDE
jgi:hypothetical protein